MLACASGEKEGPRPSAFQRRKEGRTSREAGREVDAALIKEEEEEEEGEST